MTDSLSLKLGRPMQLRGNPWHGLVKGGKLTLPNGEQMDYPQPGGEPWQQGSTALIVHPNAPGITRTAEQQAEDNAAGREWWNTAILSGNQLYGKELPGWIYIDPNGDRWLVTTTLSDEHLSGGVATFTLSRFGVLGGAPLQHSFEVIVPNLAQSEPAINGTTGTRLERYHTNPTGSGAIFEVAVEFSQSYQLYWRWRPVGWVEVTLAGAGSECDIAVAVRKTRAQTLGGVTYTEPAALADNYYLEQLLPGEGSRIVQAPPTNGNEYAALALHTTTVGVFKATYSGYVVGMFYDLSGALHEITLSEIATTDYNDPPLVHAGPTAFADGVTVTGTWSSSRNATSTRAITYSLDASPICSYEFSVSEVISETWAIREKAGGGSEAINDYSVQSSFSPGGEFSDADSVPWTSDRIGGDFNLPWFEYSAPVNPAAIPGGDSTAYVWFDENDAQRYLSFFPVRHSNQIFGCVRWDQPFGGDLYRAIYSPEVATPISTVTLPELIIEKNDATFIFDQHAYASYCPVTGQIARDSEPVCYV